MAPRALIVHASNEQVNPEMKTSMLPYPTVSYRARFSEGETVTLKTDETLYFRDKPHRQGKRGESFTVLAYNGVSRRVYVLTQEASGSQIALNVAEELFVTQPHGSVPKADVQRLARETRRGRACVASL